MFKLRSIWLLGVVSEKWHLRSAFLAMAFDRDQIRIKTAALAERGVYVGTSSWKYEGWLRQLYTPSRYEYRGKVAATRFKRDCLAEYAETFKTVCVDAAYYTFPTEKYLQGMADQTPEDFRFGFKVTDAITIKKFPNLPRFGRQAGLVNEHFLNAGMFASLFLKPCETIRQKVGLLMFEFSKFWAGDYAHGRDFVADLDKFFGQLPKGWPYGIEMRNRKFLHPEYFEMLRRHGVTHIFNSWQDMPSVGEQMALPGSFTTPDLMGARLLLKPGRKYEEAVKLFSPYDAIKEVYPEGRAAGAELIRKTRLQPDGGKAFVYVNNRFEGNALQTIASMLESIENEPDQG